MQYKILIDDNVTDLIEKVNAHLEDKWVIYSSALSCYNVLG